VTPQSHSLRADAARGAFTPRILARAWSHSQVIEAHTHTCCGRTWRSLPRSRNSASAAFPLMSTRAATLFTISTSIRFASTGDGGPSWTDTPWPRDHRNCHDYHNAQQHSCLQASGRAFGLKAVPHIPCWLWLKPSMGWLSLRQPSECIVTISRSSASRTGADPCVNHWWSCGITGVHCPATPRPFARCGPSTHAPRFRSRSRPN
jgi:hypothetical protein